MKRLKVLIFLVILLGSVRYTYGCTKKESTQIQKWKMAIRLAAIIATVSSNIIFTNPRIGHAQETNLNQQQITNSRKRVEPARKKITEKNPNSEDSNPNFDDSTDFYDYYDSYDDSTDSSDSSDDATPPPTIERKTGKKKLKN